MEEVYLLSQKTTQPWVEHTFRKKANDISKNNGSSPINGPFRCSTISDWSQFQNKMVQEIEGPDAQHSLSHIGPESPTTNVNCKNNDFAFRVVRTPVGCPGVSQTDMLSLKCRHKDLQLLESKQNIKC